MNVTLSPSAANQRPRRLQLDSRDDVRVLRGAGREEAQRARRRRRDRQLRHRAGDGRLRPGARRRRRSSSPPSRRPGYGAVLPGEARRGEQRAPWARRLVVAAALTVPVARARDDPRVAVRRLGVGRARADHSGRALGGWPFHRATVVNLRHGAATMDTLDLARDAGGARLVDRRRSRRSGCGHVLRGGGGRDDVDPARPLPRARAPDAARATRSGRCSSSAPRTRGGHGDGVGGASPSRSCSSATCSSSGRVRRSPPTASSSTASPRSISRS